MKRVFAILLPLTLGLESYSAVYPQYTPPTRSAYATPPTPAAYAVYTPPTPAYTPPTREYVAPTRKYVVPTRRKGKVGKAKGYVAPTPKYVAPTAGYSSQYFTPPTPQYVPPTTQYVAPTPEYVAPTPEYVAPTPEYVAPTPEYVAPTPEYVAPTPEYVAPTPEYVAPTPKYVPPSPEYQYNSAYIAPAPKEYSASDTFTPAYYLPPAPPAVPERPPTYTSAYEIPHIPLPSYQSPTPKYTSSPVDNSATCTESAVGCYQGHIRLCVPGQRQANAQIIRHCDSGCMRCPSGVPDMCNSERYASDICNTVAIAHRQDRTCTLQQEGQVGCLGGPDIGYCTHGMVVIVDYCGSSGCLGNPVQDQCWPLFTPPPTTAVVLPPIVPDNICDGNFIFCWEGHIRLCFDQQPKDFAAIIQDCRSHGCSKCPSGPDMCNDPEGNSVCPLVSPTDQITVCPAERATTTYCDGFNVRHCDPTGRGIMVEYCGNRGCTDVPAMCNPIVTNDQLCNGSYVLCTGGHVRLCRDGQPMSQAQVLQNCRAQGCSNCPNAPAVCNDPNRQSLCGQVPPDIFVRPCDTGIQPMTTYCADSDVRHCDPSGRAFLVEYCQGRGCSPDPLMCNAPAVGVPPGGVGNVGGGKGGSVGGSQGGSVGGGKGGNVGGGNVGGGNVGGGNVGGGNVGSGNPGGGTQCGPRIRREWGTLPDADRSLFINAMQELYRRGECARLAKFHYDNRDFIHGTDNMHFFIWHRVLLFELESALRSIPGYECVTIPYWNYQYSNSAAARRDRRSPFGTSATKLGQGDTADCIGGPFASVQHNLDAPTPHCIKRAPTDLQSSLSCSLFIDLANIGEPTFLNFANNLQVAHGSPHISFGDTFASHYSPIDPLFWLHHANIDRTWDMWQDCHTDYWWYEPQALSQPVRSYPGIVAGDFIDNANVKWKGNSYSVSYSTDDFQDPSLYSSDFRRNVATRCTNNRLRRYDTPMPILGVDDSWTKSAGGTGNIQITARMTFLTDGTQTVVQPPAVAVQETGAFLECISAGLDSEHGPIIATYSEVSATECVSKCDKFFFKASGENNCMCTSTSRRPKTKVLLNGTAPVTRTAYFTGCDAAAEDEYGFYDFATLAQSQGASRRLLQQLPRQTLTSATLSRLALNPTPRSFTLATSLLGKNRPTAAAKPTSRLSLLDVRPALLDAQRAPNLSNLLNPSSPPASDLCFDQLTSDKPSAPPSCSEGSPKFVLPEEWLRMNGLSTDDADPCAKYQKPVGVQNIQCVAV